MRLCFVASLWAASFGILCAPLHAQDTRTLDELIPESAVSDPEAWAAGDPPAEQPREDDGLPELLTSDPLPEMAEITIPWPENAALPEIVPLEAEEPIEFAAFDSDFPSLPSGSEVKISDELALVFPSDTTLFPEQEDFLERFKSLSVVQEFEDDDNLARLRAQARDDEALLIRLLRVYGYFDGQVIQSVGEGMAQDGAAAQRPAVRFDVLPSVRYRIGSVELGDLVATRGDYEIYRAQFKIMPGDPLSLDMIESQRSALDTALGEGGYPYARIAEPDLLIDHERQQGDLAMPVAPGGKYNLGVVTSDDPAFLSGEHLTRLARWNPGEVYRRSDEADLRRAILATGVVASVVLTPVEVIPPAGDLPGTVDIEARITRAPLRTVAGSIGYGSEEGLRLEGSWEHRNLLPPEGALRLRAIAGTREQLAGVTLRKNNFTGRDRVFSLDAFASTIDYDAYDARTLSLTGFFERLSTLLYQKPFGWSVGLELVATQESERDASGVTLPRETYFVAALPIYGQLDTSNDLLDPSEGWRLGGRLSPEVSSNNGVESTYLRSQVDASFYKAVGENVVLAGRGRFASIPGAQIDAIAPSRRLYAGGGGSVRGYGYRQIGPLNSVGDPIGGRSLSEFSLEARVGTPLFDGALSVVPFIDAGAVGSDPVPEFDVIKFGAGVGLRYDSGFGPLRLDVAFPINPGPNDNFLAVYVALGQAF